MIDENVGYFLHHSVTLKIRWTCFRQGLCLSRSLR